MALPGIARRLGIAAAICSARNVNLRLLLLDRFTAPLARIALGCAMIAWHAAGVSGSFAQSVASEDRAPAIRFVNNPEAAPEFALQTLGGKPLSLASATGKVVLLNFWATWCGPCRLEIPDLIELQNHYKDQLQIIGLLVDVDDVEDAKKFVQDSGFNYPVAVATPQVRIAYGGISALPTVFVLDTQGRIVQKHIGLSDPRLYEIETRALLNLPIPFRVEKFEDTGEIFLKHADRATELPGVDFTKLSAEQKIAALHALNAEGCTCGCKLTLAQCRIYDSACAVSKGRADKIVAELRAADVAAPAPTPSDAPSPNPPPSPELRSRKSP